jgi:hypothetical protein
MDFLGCKFLKKIPDLSKIPNLARLILDDCGGLVEVHCYVGFLGKLVYLSLNDCSNITSLRSLESLSPWGLLKA